MLRVEYHTYNKFRLIKLFCSSKLVNCDTTKSAIDLYYTTQLNEWKFRIIQQDSVVNNQYFSLKLLTLYNVHSYTILINPTIPVISSVNMAMSRLRAPPWLRAPPGSTASPRCWLSWPSARTVPIRRTWNKTDLALLAGDRHGENGLILS